MRSDPTKRNDIANLSDPQIVEYFRDAALRRAKCGFNVTQANKIFDHEMVPAYEARAARGPVTGGVAGAYSRFQVLMYARMLRYLHTIWIPAFVVACLNS
jgi:hypothetical protein